MTHPGFRNPANLQPHQIDPLDCRAQKDDVVKTRARPRLAFSQVSFGILRSLSPRLWVQRSPTFARRADSPYPLRAILFNFFAVLICVRVLCPRTGNPIACRLPRKLPISRILLMSSCTFLRKSFSMVRFDRLAVSAVSVASGNSPIFAVGCIWCVLSRRVRMLCRAGEGGVAPVLGGSCWLGADCEGVRSEGTVGVVICGREVAGGR